MARLIDVIALYEEFRRYRSDKRPMFSLWLSYIDMVKSLLWFVKNYGALNQQGSQIGIFTLLLFVQCYNECLLMTHSITLCTFQHTGQR